MLAKNQIRYLKSQAHHLHPVVIIGVQGITDGVNKELNIALKSHELIKVKLGNIPDAAQEEMISFIEKNHRAELIQKIGHLAIFFRRNHEKPKVELPKPEKKWNKTPKSV